MAQRLRVEETPEVPQRRQINGWLRFIVDRCAELLIQHPRGQRLIAAIGQSNDNFIRNEPVYPPADRHLLTMKGVIPIPDAHRRR